MKRTIYQSLLITLFAFTAHAQQEVVIVRQSDRSKPAKIAKEKKPIRNVENYNAFKFDPFRMAIGELNFSWETRIHEKTTLEFEAGPTISNLRKYRLSVTPDAGTGYYQRESSMGVLVSAAVRFYPLEDYQAMNRIYVSPRFKYRRYNENIVSVEPGLGPIRGYSDEFIFSFNIGYQAWLSNNFAFDYYIGAGIGSYNGRTYQTMSSYDGNTDSWTYNWQPLNKRYASFVGVIGMKVTVGN